MAVPLWILLSFNVWTHNRLRPDFLSSDDKLYSFIITCIICCNLHDFRNIGYFRKLNYSATFNSTIVCLVSKDNLPAFIFKRLICDQAGDDNKFPWIQKYLNALLPVHVTWIKEIVYYIMNHGRLARWRQWRACDVEKRKKGWRMGCDVGEVTERLENEQSSPGELSEGLVT